MENLAVVDVPVGFKHCVGKSGCGILKPLEKFPWVRKRDSLRSVLCFDCDRARRRAYLHERGGAVKKAAATKKWKADNAEKYKEYMRGYVRDWQKNNPDKMAGYRAKYTPHPIPTNAEKYGTLFAERWRRLGRSKFGPKELTIEEFGEMMSFFNFRCAYCHTGEADTIDHIVPRSKGGRNTTFNLVPACWQCNMSKTDKVLHSIYGDSEQLDLLSQGERFPFFNCVEDIEIA